MLRSGRINSCASGRYFNSSSNLNLNKTIAIQWLKPGSNSNLLIKFIWLFKLQFNHLHLPKQKQILRKKLSPGQCLPFVWENLFRTNHYHKRCISSFSQIKVQFESNHALYVPLNFVKLIYIKLIELLYTSHSIYIYKTQFLCSLLNV